MKKNYIMIVWELKELIALRSKNTLILFKSSLRRTQNKEEFKKKLFQLKIKFHKF